jgi:hypothetical protein
VEIIAFVCFSVDVLRELVTCSKIFYLLYKYANPIASVV